MKKGTVLIAEDEAPIPSKTITSEGNVKSELNFVFVKCFEKLLRKQKKKFKGREDNTDKINSVSNLAEAIYFDCECHGHFAHNCKTPFNKERHAN